MPFRTRVITDGVTPSLHIDYKHTRIKQYHKEGRALRTETTINDTTDFSIGKRLHNLPALREIGFTANRRLLRVQTISHDPITGADALHAITAPVCTASGTRVPGLRLGEQRSHALLAALPVFRLFAKPPAPTTQLSNLPVQQVSPHNSPQRTKKTNLTRKSGFARSSQARSAMARVTSATERPRRSIAVTTTVSPARA